MSGPWPLVPLGEIFHKSEELVDLMPDECYTEVTVKLWGRGVAKRREINGSEIASSKRLMVHPQQFILSRIDARNGAFGLIPESLDGAIVSNDFPVFNVNRQKGIPKYLEWKSKTPSFIDICKSASEGTTNRVRLKEDRFLATKIPLPPLPEQRRIVARIEELAAKIEEAKEMRRQAMEKAEALLQSALYHIFAIKSNAWKRIPMTQAIAINDKQVDPTLPDYSLLPHIGGENIVSKTCKLLPYRTAEGDNIKSNNYLFSPNTILYSKIRPYLRKAVFVDFQGVCSADIYPTKVINDALVPKFVMWSLIADPFTEYANRLSGRTRMPKLNRKQLFGFTLSYPDKREQSRIVNHLESLRTKSESLEIIQEETAEELEAFLPSVLDRAFKGEL
jgi:type I restriction enzyme S subunit